MRRLNLAEWADEIERQVAMLPGAVSLALHEAGEGVVEIARQKIAEYQPAVSGGGYSFPEWEPLAFSTVDEKTRLGYAPPDNPLLRTGELRESISATVEGVGELRGMRLVVGSTSLIGRYQENGTAKIPPRPFIGPAMLEAAPLIEKELGEAMGKTLGGERYEPSPANLARAVE